MFIWRLCVCLKYIDFGLGEDVGVRLEVKIEACEMAGRVFEA